MIYRFTLQHDHGLATVTLYGHGSEESATETLLKLEKCPRRAILKIEDLSPVPRTLSEQTRLL